MGSTDRLIEGGMTVLGAVVVALIVLGPPAWVVYNLSSGGPWLTKRTVEVTTYAGNLPEAVSLLLPWGIIMMVLYLSATGALPSVR